MYPSVRGDVFARVINAQPFDVPVPASEVRPIELASQHMPLTLSQSNGRCMDAQHAPRHRPLLHVLRLPSCAFALTGRCMPRSHLICYVARPTGAA